MKCVSSVSVVGLSYGGFVAYSMGVKYREFVEKIVICGSGVCLEEKDIKDGLFPVSDLDEAANILVPQTPQKLRELVGDYVQEKRELIKAIAKDRNISELPKISKPTLIIWGEHDLVFPLELGHRLKRHLGDNAQIVVIKNAGHAFCAEKAKEFYNVLMSFLVDSKPPGQI
ncbi:hypothetical protein TSUD_77960 [Trifolium subterraneum]|uniref:AB hydrolase-1 domain-containing protein n=1 Tax=Trifolium subterraneum TaxID=3900 RepID=A0A2Z6PDD5_TRISU|nr:hypothetical protein TSUD_77960 [Trifolium subterraneum]